MQVIWIYPENIFRKYIYRLSINSSVHISSILGNIDLKGFSEYLFANAPLVNQTLSQFLSSGTQPQTWKQVEKTLEQ
jgi:hypothetical protein